MVNNWSLLTDEWMRLDSVGIYQQLYPKPRLPLVAGQPPPPEGFLPVQLVSCWSESSVSSLLLWCFSLLSVGWEVMLLSVWKGCQEPSQAIRKHRNCRRLCSASASSFFFPVGWWKRAGYGVQLQDERNKCGIPHSFNSIWHLFHYSPLWLKKSVVKTNIKALRIPTPSCIRVLGGTFLTHWTGSRKKSLLWEVLYLRHGIS